MSFWLSVIARRGVEWVGSFLKNVQERGGRYRNSLFLVIPYVVRVATELHPDTIFFQQFLAWQKHKN